ncbi:hypothetical protein SESBI_28056 [Sesbania bispinosa]|nr:hypothetical protein SESBI_28056 [Sesbania bispinosa]
MCESVGADVGAASSAQKEGSGQSSKEGEDSDVSVSDIHFDDSEEERVLDSDDGFEVPPVSPNEQTGHEPVVERASSSKKPAQSKKSNSARKKIPIRRRTNSNGGDSHNASSSRSVEVVAEEGIQHHDMEDGYKSEELVSDFNDSESDEDNKPTYGTGTQTVAGTEAPPATHTPAGTQNEAATQPPTGTQTPAGTQNDAGTHPTGTTQTAAGKQPAAGKKPIGQGKLKGKARAKATNKKVHF